MGSRLLVLLLHAAVLVYSSRVSSVVERHPEEVGVGGSIPSPGIPFVGMGHGYWGRAAPETREGWP